MVSAPARRRQVEFAVKRGLSCRRACSLLSVARSALTYTSRLDERDQEPLQCLRELAQEYPRWGYRRIRVMLARRGFKMSVKRAHRLWKKAELQVPRRRRQRRVASSRPRPHPATGANQVWAYDFVFDACANGQKLKCLTVIDEWTREVLAIDVAGRLRSGRVLEVLSRLVSERGAPRVLRSDNGPEFVSMAVIGWLHRNGIETAFIAPGKPWQNGMKESFNGKFRDECLNLEWFRTRVEARVLIEVFRRRYNEERPHSSLEYATPSAFSKANKTVLTTEAHVR